MEVFKIASGKHFVFWHLPNTFNLLPKIEMLLSKDDTFCISFGLFTFELNINF